VIAEASTKALRSSFNGDAVAHVAEETASISAIVSFIRMLSISVLFPEGVVNSALFISKDI
jgi:hypothetical protein